MISRSRWIALSRSLGHILPASGLAVLIWLNYRTYYLGPSFFLQSLLFIAAKIEELLCLASLTAIFLQTLRHELLGDGVPLGLLGSGIYFTGVSFAWSSPFLGSAARAITTWRMARLYIVLSLCGFIALAIGPASNVLMQPREQDFPAGRTKFYFNGTAEQFWPDIIDSTSQPESCTWANATDYDVCPSGGYQSLRKSFGSFYWYNICPETENPYLPYSPLCQALGGKGNGLWKSFVAQSPQNSISPVIRSYRSAFWANRGSAAIQPHAASVIVMDQLRYQWVNRTSHSDCFFAEDPRDMKTEGSAISPFVRSYCLDAQNLTAEATEALFPKIKPMNSSGIGHGGWTAWDYRNGTHDISGLNRTASAHIRTQWLKLPVEPFGDSKTGINTNGLLVELPWRYNSRAAIACAITAAWHNTTLLSERSRNYAAFWIKPSFYDSTNLDGSPDSDATNRPITVEHTWLNLLTPAAPVDIAGPPGAALNTLESISHSMKIDVAPDLAREDPGLAGREDTQNLTDAQILKLLGRDIEDKALSPLTAMTVVDGLSRYRSDAQLHAPVRVFETFQDTRVFKALPHNSKLPSRNAIGDLKASVLGWSYYASQTSDNIALACVCMYLTLVVMHLGHTFLWPILSGDSTTSSDAWESITDLLVLCLNSPPPTISTRLKNTSAGIKSLRTYSTVVKVRADNLIEKPEAPKIRLVLDEDLKGQYRATASESSLDCEMHSADVPLSADNDQGNDVSSPNNQLTVAATSTYYYKYSHFWNRFSRVVPGRKYR